nr:MAG TPA: hypothetical protein [Caudoviricetes sp.]
MLRQNFVLINDQRIPKRHNASIFKLLSNN